MHRSLFFAVLCGEPTEKDFREALKQPDSLHLTHLYNSYPAIAMPTLKKKTPVASKTEVLPTFGCPSAGNPFIVAITNLKGGVAKTTTAVHFAEFLRQFGETVLVDSDPNRSAFVWASRRASDQSFQVINEIELARYAGRAVSYVIDTKARPDEDDCKAMIRVASLIVIPTTTSGDDLRVSAQTAKLLAQAGSAIHRVLLTKVPPQAGSVEISEAKKYLEGQGIPVFANWIRQYKAYQNAFLEGVPVHEVKHPKAADAWSDYQSAIKEIFDGKGEA